jgi:hemerythrin superfamily protein
MEVRARRNPPGGILKEEMLMAARSTARSSSRRTATKKKRAKAATRRSAPRKTATRKKTTRRSPAQRMARRAGGNPLAAPAQEMMEKLEMERPSGDAIELLEQDHREVESMFEEFEELDDDSEKLELARKICAALTVHAEVEESVFYPRARKALDEQDLLDEAEVEHNSAKLLIAEILAMRPKDKLFDAKVKVLGEYIKHHVKEEEDELFPKLRDSGMDMDSTGKKLMQQKMSIVSGLAGRR